jgi:hypothetical protein
MRRDYRRESAITTAVILMIVLSGCTGPVVEYEGPSQVIIFNNSDQPADIDVQITSDGESYTNTNKTIRANDSLRFGVQLPGRKLLGERYYNVTVTTSDGNTSTESFGYEGFQIIRIIIEEDGAIQISTVKAG